MGKVLYVDNSNDVNWRALNQCFGETDFVILF